MNIETIVRTPKTQTHATPLLFVHGMWHGAWCWDEFFLPFFAEHGYHVTALSLRGHAGSEGEIKGSSIANYVSDVEQVAKTFDMPPVIIGHSMGGFITQKYLETNSAPVGVLLSSIPCFGAWPGTARVFMHSPLALMKVILLRRLSPAVEKPADARWALFSKDMPEEQLLKYHAKLDDESFRAYMDLLGLNLVHPKRIKTSLLVLGAEEDNVISRNNVNATARAYRTKAEFFPKMGHDVMLGAGWQPVAERISNWLKRKEYKMKASFIYMTVLMLLLQACTQQLSTPTTAPTDAEPSVSVTEAPLEDTAAHLERLGGVLCPDSDFTCINVTVPLDHFDSQNTKTLDVVFAVLPATGERKGMFVTVIGGPGGSGLLSADSYTSYFDPALTEHFDIVFFDQRGINASNGLYCAQAASDYYREDTDASTTEGEQHLLEVTQTFVDDCIAEIGETDLLPYLDTTQAVEDLEAFRALMGDEKFWLYGESYGTQFAQTYATSHADHIAGLVLDGVVDLTLTDIEFLKGQATAFNDVLVATLQACNENEACAADMGRDAVAVYDELAAQLKLAPVSFDFPLSIGPIEKRDFTLSDLESVAGFLYSEGARMIFLRALAAYSRDHTLVPLARVAYNALYLNPDTFEVFNDPSYSDAIYYGVTCRDYAEPGDTPEEQAENFIRAGDEIDSNLPRFSSIFYGDLPCVYWPYPQEDDSRIPSFTGEGFTTLVLNGTTDPATPYSNSQAVYSHLSDGYFVTEIGGPHVIFGWGIECVDRLVTEFLVEDKLPAERETVCEGVVTDDFVPLALADAADYESPLDALAAVDNEIYYLPEYYYMSSTTARAIACPYGGALTFEYGDTGDVFTLTECAFSKGFVMTGNGSTNYDEGSFTLEVTVSGLKEGSLTYVRDGEGSLNVTGTYGNEEIDLSE